MDLRIVPLRNFRKKSASLLVLILFVPALLVILSGLGLAILKDLGYEDPNTPVSSGGPAGVILIAGTAPLLYLWKLRRHQRRLQRALQDLNFIELTKDGRIGLFLYLRSFRFGRSTLLRRFVPYAYGDQSLLAATFGFEVFHFEEDTSNAISPYGLLIAMGDRGDSYGAGKVIVSDEKWKDRFHQLANQSWMIFMQPDLTQSVRWEIGQLRSNTSYLRKTVWFMPRSGGDKWTEIRDGLRQEIGVVLPPYDSEGGMFRLCPDSGNAPIVPKIFVSTLTSVLEEAKHNGHPLDVERLWELALANDRDIRANDQALRDIGMNRKRLVKFR